MRKMLALGALVAALAFGGVALAQQDTSRCATVTVSTADSDDIPALLADAECFARAMISAANSQALRLRKAKELSQPKPSPSPAPTPAPTPSPSPSPPPTMNATPAIVGQVPAVASTLDVAAMLHTTDLPSTAKPDVVGAFRFLCSAGQLSYDDPIVYPGQPGRAHLHQFFGNLEADARSTYESLRKSGETTCHNELNRSAYWMPAMLDGKGNVVRPDYISIYYKRRPASDPFCTTAPTKGCVDLPRGLRFVFGWDQSRPDQPQPENGALFDFKCIREWTPTTASYRDMVEVMKACGPGSQVMAQIHTPDCWDGRNLDSPDHRSHVAQMVRDPNTGRLSCPTSHPYHIAQFTLGAVYSIEAGDDPTLWHLASDHMIPANMRRPGASFHSDWYGAWEESILTRWHRACIDKLLSCSDGNLGDGFNMRRNRHYPSGKANPRLVPVPANHAVHT